MSGIDSRHCKISTGPFWKCRLVEIFRYQESIWDIIIYLHMKFRWNRTMLNLCGIVATILKMATGRNFYVGNQFGTSLSTHISNFVSWYRKISTSRHFQNGRHNTAKIQHCSISTKFHMQVDNDVRNWFPTLQNFYWSPFAKWPPQYHTNSTLFDIIKIWYVGR
jgi:hypothetical protein